MFDFNPEITIASKLPEYQDPEGRAVTDPAFAGVSFTIHQMTDSKRLGLRLELADTHAKLRGFSEQFDDVREMPKGKEQTREFNRISEEANTLRENVIDPARVRHLLVRVNGLTLKGQPITGKNIMDGPPALYREIAEETAKLAAPVTEQERGESEPPTTSSAQGDGRISSNNTTALTVVK